MASTLLNEQGWNRDVIERQLAHGERDEDADVRVMTLVRDALVVGECRTSPGRYRCRISSLRTG